MGNKAINFEKINKNFMKLTEQIKNGKSCSVFGVVNSMRPAVISSINQKTLYVTAGNVEAVSLKRQFDFMGLKTLFFPSIPDSFLYKKSGSTDLYKERSKTLFDICMGDFDVVVAPVQALAEFLPSSDKFIENIILLKTGETIFQNELENKLVMSGYKRETLISEPGQFSKRGEIFDIFPINSEVPFRVDFFDNEIETIKIFDITTQKGTKNVEKIRVCPFTDLFLSESDVNHISNELKKVKEQHLDNSDLSTIFNAQVDEIVSRIAGGDRSYSLNCIAELVQNFHSNISDYLSVNGKFIIAIDESKQVYDVFDNYIQESLKRIKELVKTKTLISGAGQVYLKKEEILDFLSKNTCLAFLKITSSNRFFKSDAVFDFKSIPSERFVHNSSDFSKSLRHYEFLKYKIIVFSGGSEQQKSIGDILSAHGIEYKNSKTLNFDFSGIQILESGFETGFILPEDKVYVIGTYDIFPQKRKTNKLKSDKNSFTTIPKVGDYVVHEIHGIGVCEGVTKLSGSFGTKDYVVVRYRDDDKLYVPTTQMDLLSRFTGAEEPKKLSKIGGVDFSAVKERAKQSIKKLAINLIELYAKREKIRGYAFSKDNELQREFENSFPYNETEDQLASVSEIKKDMESYKVMDRLLCGDVGFGKTEVALRACFKAIMDGKQVAFVAPTTILSEQHYNTARARMMSFGVNIEVLNRFKTKSETEKILRDISEGNVDLVCGTHRIFSKDVEFRNLGLIILDEEQKFGVEDKEKLKNKYPDVDCLTLSATPIPRTLNMSLTGIRDISTISTPPSERLPVQTYVTEYSDSLVKDAVERELARDGQVFILFNSVEKIYAFAESIKRIVPEAEIAIAHGQMSSKALENVIYDFYQKKTNVLICTTIIENGVDIENANTIIIVDSDKLGLAQLYQIRGRVGRGARLAYAYLTYKYSKVLTEEAYKRLDAMSEFCEFGSGFKLSMRDLEIRGGGNILGAEQSGHLQKIGYDMYFKLLSETIKEIRGEDVKPNKEVLIKVAIDAYVPDTYVATSEDRMVVYRRISMTSSIEEAEKLKVELVETYGEIPKVVSSLIDIALVRHLAGKVGAIEVNSFGATVSLIFEKNEDITGSELLANMIFKFRSSCKIDTISRPTIKFDREPLCIGNFEILKKFLLLAEDI